MEMFYRRRSKKAHQPTFNAESPASGLVNHVPPSPSSHCCTLLSQDTHFLYSEDDGNKSLMQNHIEAGYLYEVDHANLPPRTPVQLRSIRVVMVCERTDVNVTVRFPSMESLRVFFNYTTRETHPTLDEMFVMGSVLAEKVLFRLIPEVVFTEQKGSIGFWLINSSDNDKDNVVVTQKKGSCLSEALKGNGMVRWGVRRQVKYLGRHKSDGNVQNSYSSFVNGVLEESQMELGASFDERGKSGEEEKEGDGDDGGFDDVFEDEGEEEEDDEEKEEEEEVREKIKEETNKNLKRKRYSFRNLGTRKSKKAKLEIIRKQKQQKTQNTIQVKKKKKRMRLKEELIQRDPKERWSAERYKLAEKNLLVVMKQERATAEKPILRPQLRAEARKMIGDTGLLDHLLKHMAGKIAPGGEERFRRRHNPDGAMEYWLESADLVSIRKEAGVTDAYWVPPPGWKPGDSPTQDPICARELKLLRDDISSIRRDLELRAANMRLLEEEVARLRRELEISSNRRREENQAITAVSNRSEISQKLDLLVSSLENSKCDLEAHVSLEKYKEQLMVISDFVKEIEDKIQKLAPKQVGEISKAASSFIVQEVTEMREKGGVEREAKSKQEQVQALTTVDERETLQFGKGKDENKSQIEEEKAAKIKRLKSGFRICKPQGTFLWPDMVKDINSSNSCSSNMMSTTQQVFVQVEVPTPPSVSSSTAAAPPLYHHHYQPPVVKPVAEKRAVTVTVSTLSKVPNYDSISTTTTPLVDLNDAPPNINATPLQEPNSSRGWWESGGGRNHHVMMGYNDPACCCSSSATSEVGNWLALSTLKSASDDSSHG
ncbi:hypothetical protein ACS0TY_001227 [Phlomoides rotata]